MSNWRHIFAFLAKVAEEEAARLGWTVMSDDGLTVLQDDYQDAVYIVLRRELHDFRNQKKVFFDSLELYRGKHDLATFEALVRRKVKEACGGQKGD